jgi:uncharacterized protein YbbC (DUF1343 family)
VAPSPNLRSAEAALAYPGVALLEATNVAEGRGTETPFLLFGAPWMNAADVAKLVAPGFALEPERFTPKASEAAPEPKYADEECAGVRVKIADARAARPYELGIALLRELRRLHDHEFGWRDDGKALDRLLGTPRVRAALERGETTAAIVLADKDAHAAWLQARKASLLY